MRNLFLALLLANLLFLAWQFWILPEPPPGALQAAGAQLDLVRPPRAPGPVEPVADAGPPAEAAIPTGTASATPDPTPSPEGGAPPGQAACLRFGPMPDGSVARQAAAALAGQGYQAELREQPGQVWLGHWVQIRGFTAPQQAEAARQRLMAGGLVDAYLMDDGPSRVVSLGVFRERVRAERIAAAAQRMGFSPVIRDRVRPTVEPWVLVRLAADQRKPAIPDLGPGGAWIVRAEATVCPAMAVPPPADIPVVP